MNEEVIRLRISYPCMSGAEIARRVGLSRERVRQLLSKSNLINSSVLYHTQTKHCLVCNKKLSFKNKSGYCLLHRVESNSVPVVCSYCGKLTHRKKCEILREANHPLDKSFCNAHCRSKYLIENHIILKNPSPGRKRKINYDLVWQKHLETGYGCLRLSRLFGVTSTCIAGVLRTKRIKLAKE